MEPPKIKESILKKQVDIQQLQLSGNFTSNASLVSTTKVNKVITRLPLQSTFGEGLGPSASFTERPNYTQKIVNVNYSNTSVNTVRKSS